MLELIEVLFFEKNADLMPQLSFAQLPFFCQFIPASEEKSLPKKSFFKKINFIKKLNKS